ncbi:tetratricopeptide repeat-containing serine protease family protein [Acaryochloris sp. IP29b_bin.148]|uniref:tetratricopeptide repeat-containing S1 family peptidase n=1 Tax=Acaryochloris sp. IP29b_bin.148 TaxID=2969218 RepID=UPI00260786BF|nr:tetratricopeptide repeat-containing serine protease family protein [Acaryochloris sp. IP29b_bin.148]
MHRPASLTAFLLGTTTALVWIQPQAQALSAVEVSKLAKSVTVRISSPAGIGSGVIVQREGNTYSVATAAHVVDRPNTYEIQTPDQQVHTIKTSGIQTLQDVDLAVVQFNSNKTYAVAKMGNANQAPEGTSIYVAGFPAQTLALTESIYNFTEGKVTANATQPLADGYALVYSNSTLPGMSGGPVLDDQGRLIAIHGRADTATIQPQDQETNPEIYIKTGFNLGIPINTFLSLLPVGGIKLDLGTSAPRPQAEEPTAADFYLKGGEKLNRKDYQGAIADFTQAIDRNPDYAEAYYSRSLGHYRQRNSTQAIEDLTQAIDRNPDYAQAYLQRGVVQANSRNAVASLNDYRQALRLSPLDATILYRQGLSQVHLRQYQSALRTLNRALAFNPRLVEAKVMRGVVQVLNNTSGSFNPADQAKIIAELSQIRRLPFNATITDIQKGLLSSLQGDLQTGTRQLQTAAFKAQREGENQLNDIIRATMLKLSRR